MGARLKLSLDFHVCSFQEAEAGHQEGLKAELLSETLGSEQTKGELLPKQK